MTTNCKKALARIFKLCDENNDGILSDDELNAFQTKCFGSPLQPQALEDVKSIIKRTITDGIFDDGLTLTGFLFLHTLFIQRGRHETTWTVLRKFGYNDSVELEKEYLHPPLDIPDGCSVELTRSAYRFLHYLFDKHDVDGDEALSPSELENMFSICPSMVPEVFDKKFLLNSVETNEVGWVTLSGFLSIWTLMTHVEPKLTLKYLALFGYNIHMFEDNQLSAVQVTRDKRVDLDRRQTNRNVFSCHLIGPQGAGKSSFMKGFLGFNLEKQELVKEQSRDNNKGHNNHKKQDGASSSSNNILTNGLNPNYSVNQILIYGQEKYLIIREVDIFSLADRLTEPELLCDVVCLMYDVTNPRSFEYVARIYLKQFHDCRLPILILGAKADQPAVIQSYEVQPEEFCSKFKLTKPQTFSVNPCDGEVAQDIYVTLGTMAAYPTLRRLVHVLSLKPTASWVTQNLNQLQRHMPQSATLIRTGIGFATIVIASFFLLRMLRGVNR